MESFELKKKKKQCYETIYVNEFHFAYNEEWK